MSGNNEENEEKEVGLMTRFDRLEALFDRAMSGSLAEVQDDIRHELAKMREGFDKLRVILNEAKSGDCAFLDEQSSEGGQP